MHFTAMRTMGGVAAQQNTKMHKQVLSMTLMRQRAKGKVRVIHVFNIVARLSTLLEYQGM